MTWSIVAKDAASGAFGVAVASKVLAVGAICPWLEAGTGALSTQSYTNPLYGSDVLTNLAAGDGIEAAISAVISNDEGRAFRQVHGVDAQGNAFAYTGASCVDWNGHTLGEGISVAGNMLAGPRVVDETMSAWTDGWAKPFAHRLMYALAAGEAAGGDKRGKQSAAIRIVKTEPWPWIDLRVDDAAEPVRDLSRMLDTFVAERSPYYITLATRSDPAGVYDPAEREAYQAGYRKALGEEQ